MTGRRLPTVAVLFVVLAVAAGCSTPAGKHAQTVAPGVVSPSAPPTSSPPTSSPPTSSPPTPPVTTASPPRGTQAPTGGPPCGFGAAVPARYSHVVWIWMENRTYGAVLGNAAAPYENTLVRQCGTDRAYHDVGSPSLPNYLGATSGQTWGIADDSGPAAHPLSVDNLFRQVRVSGGTERSYVEDMPADCAMATDGRYAVKHNPEAYYLGGGDRAACLADDVPLGTTAGGPLIADLDGGRLPSFALVVPNICDDGHDCSATTGDRWLATWLPHLLDSPTYRSGGTAVFIVWDESTPMPNIVVSPTTPPGLVSTAPVDHYGLLRTTEELLGLPLLGRAQTAASLRPLFGL